MKPICVPCQRFYRPKKNGVLLLEGMPIGQDVKPGTAEPEKWAPYKVWVGDLWECEGCGHETIAGVPSLPVTEHYQSDFKRYAECVTHKVNDC